MRTSSAIITLAEGTSGKYAFTTFISSRSKRVRRAQITEESTVNDRDIGSLAIRFSVLT